MAIVRCEKGHFFDNEKFLGCPHCTASQNTGSSMHIAQPQPTFPLTHSMLPEEKTIAKHSMDFEKTERFSDSDDEKTISIYKAAMNTSPVVGWLVCTSGPERGRDYRIRAGRNFIGRSCQMDVCIVDDTAISREKHASIIYDPKSSSFTLLPGESTRTYYQGISVTDAIPLTDGDSLGLGESRFDFVAYCREGREWHT